MTTTEPCTVHSATHLTCRCCNVYMHVSPLKLTIHKGHSLQGSWCFLSPDTSHSALGSVGLLHLPGQSYHGTSYIGNSTTRSLGAFSHFRSVFVLTQQSSKQTHERAHMYMKYIHTCTHPFTMVFILAIHSQTSMTHTVELPVRTEFEHTSDEDYAYCPNHLYMCTKLLWNKDIWACPKGVCNGEVPPNTHRLASPT